MKKLLIATTALVATASVASADMKLSGYGRFGLDYANVGGDGISNTQVNLRTRINIDGSVETDSGVTFGTRVRLQYSSGQVASRSLVSTAPSISNPNGTVVTQTTSNATLNAAMVYATYQGMRLEVGNANTAYDSAALMYNSEIGYLDRSFGDPQGAFFAYASTPYTNSQNRMGVFFSYAMAGFTGRISYITPDQTAINLPDGKNEEIGISGDYKYNQFTFSAAYVHDGAGISNNQQFFVGAEYAFSPQGNVGLQYFSNGDSKNSPISDDGKEVTLYGNYTMGALTYKGYVSHNNATFNRLSDSTKTTFGIGADYDLGGARLSGDIHRSNSKDVIAGLGVRFDF